MESTTNPSTPAGEPISSPPTPAAMQVLPCSLGVAITIVSQVEVEGMTKSESTTMLCESGGPGLGEDPALLSLQELELICDLFYLPCEHGQKVGATTSVFISLVTLSQKGSHFLPSHIRHEDFCRLFVRPSPSVTLVLPPLISEMGWTGELWSKTKFLILEN